MANAPAPVGIAPRYNKPAVFGGTDVAWRVLCDLYPAAETPEIILAVVDYCAARRLEPLRKPVHIVPIYNSKLKRRVQVVMQGINELETTAHRTKLFAGADEADYGPDETREFSGSFEDDRTGQTTTKTVRLTYPTSAAVTVYRLVGGERRAFRERVFFTEAYGRAGFRSDLPNERWTKAPRQMLAKCAKAAALRLAFPEEMSGEYAAEEMDGREVEAGGVTIEGHVDHGDAKLTERDRRITRTPPAQPPGDAVTGIAALGVLKGDAWLKALRELVKAAANLDELAAIQTQKNVAAVMEPRSRTPTLIRDQITADFKAAHDRILAAEEAAEAAIEDPGPPTDDGDPGAKDEGGDPFGDDPSLAELAELVAEVNTMDLIALNDLPTSAAWRAKTRDLFPPDHDTLDEAIVARKAELSKGNQ